MSVITLPYSETGYFSTLICDYLEKDPALEGFYHREAALSSFKAQLEEKRAQFTTDQRKVLATRLLTQYKDLPLSQATLSNIDMLKESNSFTITTGHQLNLFSGPLYFLYKIISVINLAETLSATHPNDHFIPVFWMATEDHDFEEINYFNLFGKKVAWEKTSKGAVGRMATEGLGDLLPKLKEAWGESDTGRKLLSLFSEAYTQHPTLADATRFLANALFGQYGLVIIDGDDAELKKQFIPYVEKELTQNQSFRHITETTRKLTDLGYPEQVHPREINLFYLKDGLRERIIERDGTYFINETRQSFNIEELRAELHAHPERFSPNALLRPLYQEIILPNLCYVGGGGELAYWFQLKDYFDSVKISFPILLLRNSVLLLPKQLSEKLTRMNVPIKDLFQSPSALRTKYTHQLSNIEIDFSPQRAHLQQQFKELYDLAEKTDASFIGAVAAQEKKQLNGLDHLEKRLLKAQKRKLEDALYRLSTLQSHLFPQQSLQERHTNFSEFYLAHGENLLFELKEKLDPLRPEFTIITL
ncbi:bacillithiol biosynthesis cysteine-adding enzyme BshC [Altibacter sp.]|uniref:bacillithiol biosynthesis cysteine-adding enzyme BshC n=1 Tax=Altibacter sp. TaxID=2024823 RepID=UPI000C8AE685|nr:bacillithiol biosynthesis cysteine-adding enzyme BshC [Altibacter sp.]MAP54908.1 bacillithiol biosynthesis cysteine-adding enzyme BshC [Altibacter sp.]|tara:strand:+ start:532 stop:2127 length:1596 start_codon:yes stop_codon:yes gene_type:complete